MIEGKTYIAGCSNLCGLCVKVLSYELQPVSSQTRTPRPLKYSLSAMCHVYRRLNDWNRAWGGI